MIKRVYGQFYGRQKRISLQGPIFVAIIKTVVRGLISFSQSVLLVLGNDKFYANESLLSQQRSSYFVQMNIQKDVHINNIMYRSMYMYKGFGCISLLISGQYIGLLLLPNWNLSYSMPKNLYQYNSYLT